LERLSRPSVVSPDEEFLRPDRAVIVFFGLAAALQTRRSIGGRLCGHSSGAPSARRGIVQFLETNRCLVRKAGDQLAFAVALR